jgi:hypothetical protein
VDGAVDHLGQAGVGQRRDGHAGMRAQVAEVLVHLRGAGGAVEPDDVGAHGVEGEEGGADLGAGQHAAGELDGDLHLDGHLALQGGHGPPAADHGRLHAEQVELRLDEEEVDATLEQAVGHLLVGVAQLGEADVAEGRHLGAGADGAGHPPGSVGRGCRVGRLAGDLGGLQRQLVGPVGDVVLGEGDGEGAEAGGLDGVDADGEVLVVHGADEVGSGVHQDLVAALEGGPAEVVGGEVARLDPRAEGAVEDDDPFPGGVEEVHPGRLPTCPPGPSIGSGGQGPAPARYQGDPSGIWIRTGSSIASPLAIS